MRSKMKFWGPQTPFKGCFLKLKNIFLENLGWKNDQHILFWVMGSKNALGRKGADNMRSISIEEVWEKLNMVQFFNFSRLFKEIF